MIGCMNAIISLQLLLGYIHSYYIKYLVVGQESYNPIPFFFGKGQLTGLWCAVWLDVNMTFDLTLN